MILYPRHSHPATTCSVLFRILVVVALTAELVNASAPEEEPGRQAVPSGRDTRTSEFGGKGEELTKNVGLHLRSWDFDLTYTVPKNVEEIGEAREPNSDDELIARAMRHKIFLTPEEWDAGDKRRRIDDGGDTTYGNRIGLFNIPVPKVKPECRNSLICDEVESYPTEEMEKIANNLGSLSALASRVSNTVPANRMGDGGNSSKYKSLCNSTMMIYRPKSVRKGYDKDWKFVVNGKEFVQEFYITVCKEADSPCKISGKSLEAPSMYGAGSACRQQHVEQRMVVVGNRDAIPYADSYLIPSSCCCHKTGLNIPYSRFGGNSDHRRRRPHDTRSGPHRHPRDD